MSLTPYEKKRWQYIQSWEQRLGEYEPTDIERSFEKWLFSSFQQLPDELRNSTFAQMDNWLFHLHAYIQGSQWQHEAQERILSTARAIQSDITELEDLQSLSLEQLVVLADHNIAKHRLYSFIQGGLTGTGGVLLLGVDIPLMIALNLRAVQLVAMTYGHNVNTPFEMMTSLKVFHAAALPKRLKYEGWQNLRQGLETSTQRFFYEGTDELTNETWLEQPLKQLVKMIVVYSLRRKLIQGIPVIGMGIGATLNYQLTRKVTEYAHTYYQYRYIYDKKGINNE
ncbi:EcsC family protein [Bacillus sp. HMF5848]|uniref:EcsC family protein n=1 Tax=Bacillus sp. HMF5848 TaxID=2495421 RepID=UPI000F798FAB|nr:EcsC family protein [Bacillus sp. HMF5848]RSK28165.1 EcsC family protein [Bacillus sp. HMF5848]